MKSTESPRPALDVRVQRRAPTSRCRRRQRQSGKLLAQLDDRVDRVLHLLVRHQPAHDADARGAHDLAGSPWAAAGRCRSGRRRSARRRPRARSSSRVARDPVTYWQRPVEPGGERALDPPADLADHPRVDHRPLLAVHVVHQHDDRLPRHQPGEERHAVLDVDDQVGLARGPPRRRARMPSSVDRALRPPPHVADAVDRSSVGAPACAAQNTVTRAAALDESLAPLLEGPLGPATLRVAGVAPAEERDVEAGEGGVGVLARDEGTGRPGAGQHRIVRFAETPP